MKKALVAVLIFVLSGCSSSDASVKTISELNDAATPAGTYEVAGYLVLLDDCGFCPPGAACEVCAGPVFSVLAETRDRVIEWSAASQEIVAQLRADDLLLSVNLEDEDQLEQGMRHLMTVDLADLTPYGGSNRLATVLEFSERP
ncbi:MAG: hypothetical protein OEM84_08135 [Acidimicrobiia bacterium]|nr:hypothetical protein [Acidimicrobiia bacterium]MDH5614965.1 hypothetical protein [Acidimicrobiia bacterium]